MENSLVTFQKSAWIVFSAIAILLFSVFIVNRFPNPEGMKIPAPGKTGTEPDSRPSEWIWLQRTFPYGRASADAYSSAIKTAKHLRKTRAVKNIEWEFAGPSNIGGRIVDIEFDPRHPDTVYAAAATGGVFKSTDGGNTWLPVFDDQAVLSIGDIGIDPVNTDIIYVGTGEANGGHNNFPGAGVYKSADGGQTWRYMGLEETRSIGRILINPGNTQQVFVAAVGSYFGPDPYRGVFVSEDGGETWDYSLYVSDSTGAIDLIMDPLDPSFLMAAMWERVRRPVFMAGTHLSGPTSGIYRTKNGGKNWELIGAEQGLPDAALEPVGRIGLALYPANADTIYALYSNGNNYSGLYRSVNRGDFWELTDPRRQIAKGTGGFSWYFGQIRVRPDNPDIVYAMDVAFMRSVDGGLSWPLVDGYSNTKGLHVDHHALAFHPKNPLYIINGNDGGINISGDGGDTWKKVASLPVTQFYEIGLDAQNPERLFGGTQDNGTLGTFDGYADTWENILGGDGFYVIVDPEDPDIIYAEWQFGNLYKIDHGTYSYLLNGAMESDTRNWSTPVVMDPGNNTVLYYGASRLYRTEDAGQNWSAISENLTRQLPDSRLGTITTIAVAPSNSKVIYAGTDDGLVWVSNDYGASWSDISDGLPFRWVTRVVVDPRRDSTAYVTFSGLKWKEAQPHVFRTTSMGQSWTDISGNLPDAPVNAFAVDPKFNTILYCGTDVGVFSTFDTGKTWISLANNLPVVVINDMKIHEEAYQLVVGTHGRSMYRLDLSMLTGIENTEQQAPLPAVFELLRNYPNPFNQSTRFTINLAEPGSVQIRIYDRLGRDVYGFPEEYLGAGSHGYQWDGKSRSGSDAASGLYYLNVRFRGRTETTATHKMMLLR